MGNNSESKEVITNYIKGWRNHYSRFSIDAHLLEQGCDPVQVDAAWRELNRPRPWWQRLQLSKADKISLACFAWLGCAICLNLMWPSMEGHYTRQPFLYIIATLIAFYLLLLSFMKANKRPGLRHGFEFVAFLVAFLLCCAPPAGRAWEDYWTWYGPVSDKLYSQLNTSDSHYLLVSNFGPPKNYPTDGFSYPGMKVHLLQLYRCNTFGFGCQLINQQETDETYNSDFESYSLYCLKRGPDGQITIIPTGTSDYKVPPITQEELCTTKTQSDKN